MRVIGVIPARYKSSRLEGKALADINGKTMVQHVYERARLARNLNDVLVATDDERILRAVAGFGGRAVMTSVDHRSGTDRVAQAIASDAADVIVNIQGDEPMLDPIMIEEVVEPFRRGTAAGIVTLKKEVFLDSEFADPSVVKVVTDALGFALYFSRSLIPFPQAGSPHFRVFEHVGIYAYSRESLLKLAALPVSPLEEVESLEQLRALENGISILVVETASKSQSISVDTAADLERVRAALLATSAQRINA
jgi:3-deoxy-manno-octulosonate cytidylyltransferase (CMP-KDO synthetase)